MASRHSPHQALAGLMAKAQVQAERQPVWRPAVPSTQRRALRIVAASTFMALAAGAALMWDGAGDVAPRAVPVATPASETSRPPILATPTPPLPFASIIPSAQSELPRREEAPRVAATASGPVPPGVVPDDMPSSP